jgi:hypothetical protein
MLLSTDEKPERVREPLFSHRTPTDLRDTTRRDATRRHSDAATHSDNEQVVSVAAIRWPLYTPLCSHWAGARGGCIFDPYATSI